MKSWSEERRVEKKLACDILADDVNLVLESTSQSTCILGFAAHRSEAIKYWK